jgi:MFS family permease
VTLDVAAATPEKDAGFLTVFRQRDVRSLALSRASAKLSLAVIAYGSMVYLAANGGSQLEISLVSASTYLSAVLFGVQGGALADSLSKRMAIASGYIVLALLSIFVPIMFGTGVMQLIAMMFIASALMQIISPSLKAIVAIVASPNEMAIVSVSVSIAGSIASAVGSAIVAPVLIKWTSIEVVFYVAAAIMLFGAYRALKLPAVEKGSKMREAVTSIDWRPVAISPRYAAQWFINNRSISTLVLIGAMVVAIFEAFNTLIPVYVRDVLDANPTNAVYIFAPAGIGFLIGMFATPKLIKLIGARSLAVTSVLIMAVSMILFGLVDIVAPVLAPFSPLRLGEWAFGVSINDKVLAASLIALPANFGSTAAGASVQNYINARVPIEQQGATFGLQEVQENLFTLMLVLLLGIVSTLTGPRAVFVAAPFVVIALVLGLIRYSHRTMGAGPVTHREAWDELMNREDPSEPPTTRP